MKYSFLNNRAVKLKVNLICSFFLQFIVLLSGFILPRFFLSEYGSKVYGLTSSIQQFLGFITLGELGIGVVIQYNLYKPLAEKDWIKVSKIVIAAKKFFRTLLFFILFYILILAAIYPFRVLEDFSYLYTFSLIISISISYIFQYYFGMVYRQLLDADQLSFIRIIPQIIQIIINLIVSILLIKLHVNIQIVKLSASLIYSFQPIVIYLFSRRYYSKINYSLHLDCDPLDQKWNGIAQHVSSVILKDTDVVILTILSSLENVSVYSVYNMVIYGIEAFTDSISTNFTAYFGELIARDRQNELIKKFSVFEAFFHTSVTVIFVCVLRLIIPFVQVYTRGINDANYIEPLFAFILTFAHWIYCTRLPYHIVIKAAGHYRQTQASAIIEALINVIISVIMVFRFGLIGVAIGTACAMLYRCIYYLIYLKKNILFRNFFYALRNYSLDAIIILISLLITSSFELYSLTYFSWFIMAIKTFLISFITGISILLISNYKAIWGRIFNKI